MNSNTNLQLTLEAFAGIVVERWLDKISKLKIGQTGNLERSFMHQVMVDAGGNPERIEFTFNYYGRFVDMGVGSGVKTGDVSELKIDRRLDGIKKGNRRKPKSWYSRTFYAERKKLVQILAEKYAMKAKLTIIENLTNVKA